MNNWEKVGREFKRDIKKHGWIVCPIYTNGRGPDFAYTIGLHQAFGHIEVLIFGGHPNMMAQILNVIRVRVRSGRRFRSGRTYASILQGHKCYFKAVPRQRAGDYLAVANFYSAG